MELDIKYFCGIQVVFFACCHVQEIPIDGYQNDIISVAVSTNKFSRVQESLDNPDLHQLSNSFCMALGVLRRMVQVPSKDV